MYDKYKVVANTNEGGLTKGDKYIVENQHNGRVDVYTILGHYLMSHRTDNFINWERIEA